MNLFWKKFNCSFKGKYNDNKHVDIYYEFEVKRNLIYLFVNDTTLVKSINHCIQDFLSIWIEKKWMYEDEDTRRLIREDRLEIVNKHIMTSWKEDWNPKGLKIRNLKITHLI